MKGRSGALGPSGRARALLVSLLVQVLLLSGLASAAERQTVRAVFAGDPAVIERIVSVLRPSLDHQALDLTTSLAPKIDPLDAVRVTPDASPDAPVAYLWLDLTAKQPTLFLVEARTRLVYARPLHVRADPDDVETELIRFVVDQSLDAMLKGNAPGVTPEEFRRSLAPEPVKPKPPPPPPVASAPPRARAESEQRWAFSAGYSLSVLAADALAHGPELGAQLRERRVHLRLALLQRLPFSVTRDDASVRLLTSGVRLVASSPLDLGSGFTASLGLGAGLDATQVTPAVTGAVPAFWVSDPLLLTQAAVEQAWGAVLLSAYGGVEWDVIAARYTIAGADGSNAVWVPSRVRPCVGISFGYALP